MEPYADGAPAQPKLSPTLTADTTTPAALPEPSESLPAPPPDLPAPPTDKTPAALPDSSESLPAPLTDKTPAALSDSSESLPAPPADLPAPPTDKTPAALPESFGSIPPLPADLLRFSPPPADLPAPPTDKTPAALPDSSESLPPLPADLLQFNGATHAERNPEDPTQPSRSVTKLTDAQKATRKIRQETERRAQDLLSKELDQLLSNQRKELEDLARRHGKKFEAIEKLISTSSHYKHKRSVNIENAKIHMKSQEINADLATGDRVRLPEIRAMVREDPKFQNLTKEQEEEMKTEVLALRQNKKVGARTTNQSAALDYRRHLTALNDEITSLSQRTGASVVAFFSRSHLEDTFEPNWICTPNATNFAQDALGKNMWDITRLFELWNCSKAKIKNPDCLASMRTECSATINGTLKTVSRTPKAVMNYTNYDTQVIQKYQCKIVGWTFKTFVSPFDINTVDDLRTLRDALRCGACFWVRMTKAEVSKHAADLVLREAAGEVIGKKRKERSDKGVKKGSTNKRGINNNEDSDDDSDDAEAGPSKKKARSKPATKAKTQTKKRRANDNGGSSDGSDDEEAGPSRKKARPREKRNSKSKGKGRASKSQLPPSNEIITNSDRDYDPED